MFRQLNEWLLKILGWKIKLDVHPVPKCVISVAPHTSNWDFIIGKMMCNAIGYKISFLMKKEWFFFPMNYILKAMGGIPVDRKRKSSMTDQMIRFLKSHERLQLAITPEATRKRNPDWKMGFYYIAVGANVPIALAYLDYKNKLAGIPFYFYPSGDEKTDMLKIKAFYNQFSGKNPANFGI
ncbi:MAG: 1-acyl-sn-glycerol-3-phosphate acyltransferase [Dysgonamonadaceae bacterium]|jgi:1-acyl-sn-glycerol-3-phosphate acyltransferase|nr:1-acyl-sn-glycerol-3-phosphate acyltransferase [Dysgonamonadaceae bacterium]